MSGLTGGLKVAIAGWGMAVPERRVTNFDLSKTVDTSDEWITERTGIKERRVAGDGETTASLAIEAGLAAIKDAGLAPTDVVHINAHATSTPQGDLAEAGAIRLALGDEAADKVLLTGTKSMTGHMLGAAGGAEAVIGVMAMLRGVLPPTINYVTPDPECDLDYCANRAREMKIEYAVKNNFGFGGTNGTLVFRRL